MAERSLEDFVESVSGESRLRIEHDFGDGFVRLRTSEAERRQAAQDIRNSENIVLELLRNARDAHAAHIFIAMAREADKRTLVAIDDGDGIPASMHGHVFEPRVTSKLDTNHMDAWGMHGRGMALYSISVNSETAEIASSEVGLGCSVRIVTDVSTLPERTDQSSFPSFELTETGSVNVRGPRNILRTTCEFAIEARDSCSVFIGSPVEIAATLYAYGMATLSSVDRVFCRDWHELPLVKRLATSADPEQFSEIAREMGLEVSSRSARRIIDGAICELDPVLDRITIANQKSPSVKQGKKPARFGDERGVKLGKEDATLLADSLKEAFADIAERYYLEDDVEPVVRSFKDRIVVTIPVVKQP